MDEPDSNTQEAYLWEAPHDDPRHFEPWWRAREGSTLKVFVRDLARSLYVRQSAGMPERIEAVIVDLVRQRLCGFPGRVRIAMAKGYYSDRNPPRPRQPIVETEALLLAVKRLVGAGVVAKVLEWPHHDADWQVAYFSAGEKLLAAIGEHEWAETDVIEQAPYEEGESHLTDISRQTPTIADAIILRRSKLIEGKRVVYSLPRTAPAQDARKEMNAINGWCESLGARISYRGPSFSTRQRALRRIFHGERDASPLVNHGRLYGGFWINMPKTHRAGLWLDNEPVAILDYGQSFLRILYAMVNNAPPAGDLYDIPGLETYSRDAIKAFINATLNHPRPFVSSFPRDLQGAFPGLTASAVDNLIKTHHPVLAVNLCRVLRISEGEAPGPRLTYIESQILLAVLRNCKQSNIAALPIHDALLVPWPQRNRVAAFMWDAFGDHPDLRISGHRPRIICSQPPPIVRVNETLSPKGSAALIAEAAATGNGFALLARALFAKPDPRGLPPAAEEVWTCDGWKHAHPERRDITRHHAGLEVQIADLNAQLTGTSTRRRGALIDRLATARRDLHRHAQRGLPPWLQEFPDRPRLPKATGKTGRLNQQTKERFAAKTNEYDGTLESRLIEGGMKGSLDTYENLPVDHPKRVVLEVQALARARGLGWRSNVRSLMEVIESRRRSH